MMNKLRQKEAHPAFLVAFIALLVITIAYFAFIKPEQDVNQAKKEWTSPEGMAKRSPDTRKQLAPDLQSKLDKIKADERAKLAAKQSGSN